MKVKKVLILFLSFMLLFSSTVLAKPKTYTINDINKIKAYNTMVKYYLSLNFVTMQISELDRQLLSSAYTVINNTDKYNPNSTVNIYNEIVKSYNAAVKLSVIIKNKVSKYKLNTSNIDNALSTLSDVIDDYDKACTYLEKFATERQEINFNNYLNAINSAQYKLENAKDIIDSQFDYYTKLIDNYK